MHRKNEYIDGPPVTLAFVAFPEWSHNHKNTKNELKDNYISQEKVTMVMKIRNYP